MNLMVERPSVYLVELATAMSRALDFFLAKNSQNKRSSATEKRVVFIAQIEMWDWQLENLVYFFQSFKERAKAWEGDVDLQEAISKNSLAVKAKYITGVRWSNSWNRYSYKRSKTQTVAPFDVLNGVIDKWNELIDVCEDYYDPQAVNAIKLGADLRPNLQHYKKERVPSENEVDGPGTDLDAGIIGV